MRSIMRLLSKFLGGSSRSTRSRSRSRGRSSGGGIGTILRRLTR